MAAVSTKKLLTSMPLNGNCEASTGSFGLKLGRDIHLSGTFTLTLQNLEHKAFFLSGGHLKLFKGKATSHVAHPVFVDPNNVCMQIRVWAIREWLAVLELVTEGKQGAIC